MLLPGHTITRVNFYTAKVKSPPHDPHKATRQDTYWRALESIPQIKVEKGKYLTLKKKLPWREPKLLSKLKTWCCKAEWARRFMGPFLICVIKEEEKRSDVNLATQLVLDAVDGAFECAVVISNDTDLLTPIEVVKKRFRYPIGLIGGAHPNSEMLKAVDFYKEARPGVLSAYQFPPEITDARGTFRKPKTW